MESLLLEHVTSNERDSAPCGVSGFRWRLLQARLDCVDGCVGEGTHGAGDQADESSLVGWKLGVGILWLPFLEDGFEFGVGGEIDGLVGS